MRVNPPVSTGEAIQHDHVNSARHIVLSGKVQGVGFRPFIYRIATQHRLSGWVRNRVGLVEIHIQGRTQDLDAFISDIFTQAPPLAQPVLQSDDPVAAGSFDTFSILQSLDQGEANISVPADLFTCDECLRELNTPTDRRYRYPFINCTQCGPRYTLIRSLPYDRANTTMSGFALCERCRSEYEDPANRRFHAEPVACADCGPQLQFGTPQGKCIAGNEAALSAAIEALADGKVIAVKGIGGYHLMCDANNDNAVKKLRTTKPRPHKPLALLFPAPVEQPFAMLASVAELSASDKAFLLHPARPILLLQKKTDAGLSGSIAPGLAEIGVMLPYSPLHHLLLNDFGGPLVATSANISGEPVLTENADVDKRLAHVAEAVLHHDRPIERPADDPVYRIIAGRPRPIRLGRGSAPVEFELPFKLDVPTLAVGAHMKNAVTLAWGNRAIVSPHIGEMDSARSLAVFEKTVEDLQRLYSVKVERLVCDAHRGYTTTRWAQRQDLPVSNVFHHHAHASSACYERKHGDIDQSVLVFTWDGVGYGADGSLWGGETLLGWPGRWQRVASMRPFYLPGGEKAGREPWRSAAALCWETGYDYAAPVDNPSMLFESWQRRINAPQTTAVGRLFDAAAALTGVCDSASFEGQGPMQLEAISDKPENYIELTLGKVNNLLITSWEPLVPAMRDSTLTVSARAALFHASLAQALLEQARTLRDDFGVNTVSLSGGVFQNRVLTEHALALLSEHGFDAQLPELIPVNDAGISFGQIMEYGFKK
jgi:hydrogenase maturation protein HypF